jgi:dTDP-4-amino-4,6-dideoxygalactose transaminase
VTPLPFIDLAAQQRRLGRRIEAALARVLEHGQYIMGPEIGRLEAVLAERAGIRHALSCASGTDALALALMALAVRPGDAVLVPSFTFAATAEVVPWLGAVPVFVDVQEDSFNIDPAGIERGVAAALAAGLRPVGVIAVDLFGQPADYDAIGPACAAHGLWLLADAAQSFGARYRGRAAGGIGRIATTSFFPAKPLGCYGDGGAVLTGDDALAEVMRSLRVHGQGADKYDNVRIGMNGRLDTMQAAVLLEKLAIFDEEIAARDRIADRYAEGLGDRVRVPRLIEGATSVWAQYTIRLRDEVERERVMAALAADSIPSVIYYRTPLHRQTAYRGFPVAEGGLPVTEALSRVVLSLPMHPYLDRADQDRIVARVRDAVRG